MGTGLSGHEPYAAIEEAYTRRLVPARTAAAKTLALPSTLTSRTCSGCMPRSSTVKARWITTSAPANASSSCSGCSTSPERKVIFVQPYSAGSNGRRATPTIRSTAGSSWSRAHSALPKMPVAPVMATVVMKVCSSSAGRA
jgi:hypothetical protein